jgi:signal transduction histidine kinase
MRVDDGYIVIEIQDDGIGMEPEASQEGSTGQGFGLFSIRERLNPLGGFLKIDSQPKQGTRATIMAPKKQTE